MELRKAEMSDLIQLKAVFTEIVEEMTRSCNGRIWNDYYPCELFEDDIKRNELYVLTDNDIIVSAFVLCGTNEAENYIEWEDKNAKVLYIDRFGVNVNYQHQGIAGKMLQLASDIGRENGAEYLRLFVVDRNLPAVNLYIKNGFNRKVGIYKEDIGYEVLTEFGFEKKI